MYNLLVTIIGTFLVYLVLKNAVDFLDELFKDLYFQQTQTDSQIDTLLVEFYKLQKIREGSTNGKQP
jgi:hypothetical protein